MFVIQMSVNNEATTMVRDIFGLVTDKRALLTTLGQAGGQMLKNHFFGLDSSMPNKMGGKRSHFWRQVGESVGKVPAVGDSQVTITVNDPRIAQKVKGGDITPKARLWLTIPVDQEAYGMSAHEFEQETGRKLVFISRGPALAFLAEVSLNRTEFDDENAPHKGNKTVQNLKIIFVLKKHVHQNPTPGALPSDAKWQAALDKAAQGYWNIESRKLT